MNHRIPNDQTIAEFLEFRDKAGNPMLPHIYRSHPPLCKAGDQLAIYEGAYKKAVLRVHSILPPATTMNPEIKLPDQARGKYVIVFEQSSIPNYNQTATQVEPVEDSEVIQEFIEGIESRLTFYHQVAIKNEDDGTIILNPLQLTVARKDFTELIDKFFPSSPSIGLIDLDNGFCIDVRPDSLIPDQYNGVKFKSMEISPSVFTIDSTAAEEHSQSELTDDKTDSN